MKQLLLLCLFVSQPVFAEWQKYAEVPRFTSYIDPSTASVSPDGVQVWILTVFNMDLKYPQGRFRSVKALTEFDCVHERSRMLRYILSSGTMGDGNVIEDVTHAEAWAGFVPDSDGEKMLRAACAAPVE